MYFCALRRPEALRISALAAKHVCFSIDATLVRPGGMSGPVEAWARTARWRLCRCTSLSSRTLARSTWGACTASARRCSPPSRSDRQPPCPWGPRAGTARLLRRLSPHASPFAFPCGGTYGAARSEPSPTVPGAARAAPFRPRRAPGPGARSLHAAAVQEASAQGKRVYFLTNGADPHLKANASVLVSTRAARGSRAWLAGARFLQFYFFSSNKCATNACQIGCYCVLFLNMSADDSYRPLLSLKPFAPYRDASCGVSTYHLTVCSSAQATPARGSRRAPRPGAGVGLPAGHGARSGLRHRGLCQAGQPLQHRGVHAL